MTVLTKDPNTPEIIEAFKKDGMTILEVTVKRTYILHSASDADMAALMKEWFVTYRGRSHAYRDGSLVGGTDHAVEIKNLTTGQTIDINEKKNQTQA